MTLRWIAIATLSAGAIAPFATPSVQAQQVCTPLQVVGGQGTSISKAVSPPSTGVTRDNWNTDFVVPSTASYSRYVATITPRNNGDYDLKMALKYNNDTADEAFVRNAFSLTRNRSFSFSGTPRANANPYQVNISVGGISVLNNQYTLSVQGCR